MLLLRWLSYCQIAKLPVAEPPQLVAMLDVDNFWAGKCRPAPVDECASRTACRTATDKCQDPVSERQCPCPTAVLGW
ncbi:hypothetical protein PI125_g17332 [Phytophthora idaei]|nr:hypothetical protein PI125_g17332 [Phytophthora idaei]